MQELTINPNRIELDEAYMQMAEIWAKRSKANRKQVGALIVKDRQIISDGYNGMPAGDADDVCEVWHFDGNRDREPGYNGEIRTKPGVLHAESNALMKIAENGGVGAQGATLYVTMSPCSECAKLIKQAKIKRVVFREQYRDDGGIEFLVSRGVQVEQLVPTGQPLTQARVAPAPVSAPVQAPQAIRHPPAPPPMPARPPAPAPAPVPAPPPVQAPPDADAEVQALLAEYNAMMAAQQAKPSSLAKPDPNAEGPYRSSFL